MARSSKRSDTFNDAFDGLFAAAYAMALEILGDEQEAEDIAVEAMARTYSRWARLEGRPWVSDRVVLYALDLSLDVVERSGTASGSDDDSGDASADGGSTSDPDLDSREIASHEAEIVAIASLPRREREVIALRDLAGLSIEACAAALRVSERTVASLSDKGRARLRGPAVAETSGDEEVAADG